MAVKLQKNNGVKNNGAKSKLFLDEKLDSHLKDEREIRPSEKLDARN